MRLMSFLAPGGNKTWDVVEGEAVVDCGALAPNLRGALAQASLPSANTAGQRYALSKITFLPPIPDPEKIICVGLNYRSHILEGGREIAPTPPSLLAKTGRYRNRNFRGRYLASPVVAEE